MASRPGRGQKARHSGISDANGRGGFTWGTLVTAALLCLLLPHGSRAQDDRRLLWRSLHTDHFAIHYHEPLGVLARHLAANAERIHARVSKHLGLPARGRVHIVLSDGSDSANGSASVLPYNTIRLNASAPADMAPLGDYDDWLSLLLTHEHSHILHLNQASGLPNLFRRIFGNFYTPQQSLPRWVIEGIATYEESAHTSGGRLRASLFDMFMRVAALEGRLLPIDVITHDGEPWPHGNVRYLYGAKFLHFVADRYGARSLGKFAREYGARLVPYGLSRAMRRATGKDAVTLYEEFLTHTRQRAREAQRAVTARGVAEGKRLTFLGERVRTPRLLPDGRVLFFAADGRKVEDLRTVSRDGAPPERFTRVRGNSEPSPVPGTDDVIYSTSAFHRGAYTFRDLYRYRKGRLRDERLTHGLRAREPDVDPTGTRVAYVIQGAGTSHLAVAQLKDVHGTQQLLVRSERMDQVFTPRWSPDGAKIAYSTWQRGGYRDIWVLDLQSGDRQRVTFDRALDRQPAWSPDGGTLYFSSDRSGISNIYAHGLATDETRLVTNVIGGAYMPQPTPDGRALIYVGYTGVGFDLFELDLANAVSPGPPPTSEEPRPPALQPSPLAVLQSEPYSPWTTLAPRSWGASLEDGANGQQLVLDTSGSDTVGWHAWAITVAAPLERDLPSVSMEYALRRLRMPLILRGAVQHRERRDLFIARRRVPWDSRRWSLTTTTRLRLPRRFRSNSIAMDYRLSYLQQVKPFDVTLDPNDAPPRAPPLGRDASLSLNWTYNSVRRQVYDVSSSWGQRAALRLSVREPRLGSRVRRQSLSWSLAQYVPMGWQFGALAVRYAGGWNGGARLGGFASELVPVLDALVGGVERPADGARLRGHPASSGDHFHIAQVEYRFLLLRFLRGVFTLPAFARRLHAAVFVDAGDAYSDRRFDLKKLGAGVGGELRLDFFGSYDDAYTVRAGLARGVTEGGELQWYTSFARPY